MVRPQHFGYNPETAATNAFQQTLDIGDASVTEGEISEAFELADEVDPVRIENM